MQEWSTVREKGECLIHCCWVGLWAAVANGHPTIIQLLLLYGPSQELRWWNGSLDLLHLAVQAGDAPMIRYFCNSGLQVCAKDAGGRQPVHIGYKLGKLDAVTVLIDVGGATLDCYDDTGQTPLGCALGQSGSQNQHLVEYLLRNGARIDRRTISSSKSRLTLARRQPRVKIRLKSTTESSECNARAGVLKFALQQDSSDLLESLIGDGMDLRSSGPYSCALHCVIASAPCTTVLRFIELLISHGANVNTKDYHGDTPLHYLAKYCMVRPQSDVVSMARVLLSNGANTSLLNRERNSALYEALLSKKIALCDVLMGKGACALTEVEGHLLSLAGAYDTSLNVSMVSLLSIESCGIWCNSQICEPQRLLILQDMRNVLGKLGIKCVVNSRLKIR